MKKIIFIGIILVLSANIFGCKVNNVQQNTEEKTTITNLTLEDVIYAFEKNEIHIKPQIDDDYPILNNVKPKAYELLDGTVFIYVFKSEELLEEGLFVIQDVYKSEIKVHKAKNILVVYLPGSAKTTPTELAIEIDGKIQKIIREVTRR